MTQYIEHEFLGSGGFSNVYRVTVADKVYALKKIHPYLLKDPTIKNAIMKQVDIMKQINHPNIIRFQTCIQTHQMQLNLLLQYAEGGNLYNQLKIHQKFSQEKTIKYVKQITKAIQYLHQRPNPILHRDIKPQNILLTKNGTCKLADFGSSNILDQQRNTFAGTQEYMAPQIIEKKSYGKEVDLWCLGVLIYQLLTGNLPKQIDNLNFQPSLSRPAQDVIKRLLHKDPCFRMTLEQLQSHIWFAESSIYFPLSSLKHQNQISNHPNKNKSARERKQSLIQEISKKRLKLQEIRKEKQIKQKIIDDSKSPQPLIKQVEADEDKILELIKQKSGLKIKLQNCKKQILSIVKEFTMLKSLSQQEVIYYKLKTQEYQKKIQLLQRTQSPKLIYQIQKATKDLTKKVDNLTQYVQYFPTKLIEETTQIPTSAQLDLQLKSRIEIDSYINKLKNAFLLAKRDFLIQLVMIKKRQRLFKQLQ